MRRAVIAAVLAASSAVRADGPRQATDDGPHLIYVEAMGKAGAYGVGYEHVITPRLALGVAASYLVLRDQHLATAVPYLHARLLGHRTQLFGELGAAIVYSRIPSPVPEWDGMSETGGGGVAGLGWQHSGRHLVLRAQGSVVVGEGGAAPWAGFAIGFRP